YSTLSLPVVFGGEFGCSKKRGEPLVPPFRRAPVTGSTGTTRSLRQHSPTSTQQGIRGASRLEAAAWKGALMLKVYGSLLSPFVRKVRAVLAEKQLQYELVPTNPFEKSPEFLQRSPLGRIPAFEDDKGRRLADSTVIVEYLEERFPSLALLPKDPY